MFSPDRAKRRAEIRTLLGEIAPHSQGSVKGGGLKHAKGERRLLQGTTASGRDCHARVVARSVTLPATCPVSTQSSSQPKGLGNHPGRTAGCWRGGQLQNCRIAETGRPLGSGSQPGSPTARRSNLGGIEIVTARQTRSSVLFATHLHAKNAPAKCCQPVAKPTIHTREMGQTRLLVGQCLAKFHGLSRRRWAAIDAAARNVHPSTHHRQVLTSSSVSCTPPRWTGASSRNSSSGELS